MSRGLWHEQGFVATDDPVHETVTCLRRNPPTTFDFATATSPGWSTGGGAILDTDGAIDGGSTAPYAFTHSSGGSSGSSGTGPSSGVGSGG